MKRTRSRSRLIDASLGRFNIFVPAVMGVGALFWLGAILQDVFRHSRRHALERRSKIAGRGTARLVSPACQSADPAHTGLRNRHAYLVTALTLSTFAVYVFIGSYHNYRRAGGYVEDVGWLLGVATVGALAALVGATAALTTWLQWPRPRTWAWAIDRSTPLSRTPRDLEDPTSVPSWTLTSAALLVPTSALILSLLVATEWSAVVWIDERLADLIEGFEWAGALRVFDPLGSRLVALGLFMGVALASLRCRPLAASYPLALAAAFLISETTEGLVDRLPRGGVAPTTPDEFPSSHIVFATLLAGLVPLGVASLFGTRRFTVALRVLLGAGVVASATGRVHEGVAWPSDALAGALVGLTFVLWVQWTIEHRRWHRLCRGCLWAPASHGPPLVGLFHLDISVARAFRTVAHLSAAAAVLVLSALTLTEGIPTSPDGTGFGLQVQVPVQITLIAIVSIGALISWKWEAAGAIVMAFGGGGLAIFAAMEYRPATAILISIMFAVPAFLLWLAWQHRRTMAEIFTVGVIAAIVVGGSWTGAVAMHDYWFGPTHDESDALFVGVERIDWLWVGSVTHDEATVIAGPVAGASELVAIAVPVGSGPTRRSVPTPVGELPAVRLHLEDLKADTEYRFFVEVDGEPDLARGEGSFRTAPLGASSFRFAFGSCARTGSNGAVFDAIADEHPLFFLSLGDFHYANLESSDPADHRRALVRQLTTPGQAALFRRVPVAYVWDDHDYGPNDADASSPSRSAARQSYREMVPHHPLAEKGDAPIHQAFTVGRVRFVLTDTRSERTSTTMLGDRQLEWLIAELTTASRTHALVVWGNAVPWIGAPRRGGDNWNGYPRERQLIADAIADAGVENLLMLSGDAHMVAFDDGSNSDYSTSKSGGFPVMHAAALDRRGSEKGGPYSHPTFPGGGRYATVEVIDDGGPEVTVRLAGRTWEGETLIDEELRFPAGSES